MATSDAQTSNRAIITVLGSDCPGIVAAVSGALAEREANILDISQTILQGIFTMTMLVELGESVGVQITLQREDVFRYMYRL